MELLHTGVCGPLQVSSISWIEQIYLPGIYLVVHLVTFLDHCSKLDSCGPAKEARKSDVPLITKETILMLEKQSGH